MKDAVGRPLFILDFDGVIADTYETSLRVIQRMFPGFTETRYQKSLADESSAPLPYRVLRRLVSFFVLNRLEVALENSRVVTGVSTMLEKLASTGRVVIVTSGRAKAVRDFLNNHSLTNFISEIWGGNGSSDKRRGLRQMREKYALESSLLLFMTDTVGDIQQAKFEHIPVAAVTWGYQSEAVLQAAKPDYIIHRPNEIEQLIELACSTA